MKGIAKLFLILICLITVFSSCITNKQTDLLQDIQLNYPMEKIKPEEYRIIPGDQLSIVVYVWNNGSETAQKTARMFSGYAPQFTYRGLNESTGVNAGAEIRSAENTWSRPVNVYADGTITFPYLGKIYVQGLTLQEAKNIISRRLNSFAEGTTADVTLANRYFSILGEAGANRITMTNTSMTVFQALAIAATLGPYADATKVSIIRQTAAGSITKELDLRSVDIIDTEFYYIQPNDVIYIPQNSKKFFGAMTSFTGVFGMIVSLASAVIIILRVF